MSDLRNKEHLQNSSPRSIEETCNSEERCPMPIDQSVMAQFEVLNPRASALLSLLDSSGLTSCSTDQNEPNLFDQRRSPPQYVHAQSGASAEAAELVASHAVEKVDVLVIFGIGLGYAWKALLPWLRAKKTRRVIFLEDDLAIIQEFLQSHLARPFFEDNQATLLFLEEGEEGKQAKQIVIWYVFQRSWSFLASPAYLRYRPAAFQMLEQELTVHQNEVSKILLEYLDFKSSPLRNFGRNIYLWKKSLNAASMFNKFRGCPAIVVGAGPSLEKELEHLKKLDSRALILAGGSSVNALLQAGIMPHMAASVDPNSMQYVRLRQTQPFCLPLFYRSRALFEALLYQYGPLLYLRGGDGYPMVEWFEQELGIHGKILDGGHSVSNMLIDIAHALGCRPIIMVGYDLAYTGGARYASSISESMAADESVAFTGQTRGELVQGRTYEGREVVTEAKWMTEAEWIEQFQNLHPRLRLINTAQDGLAIHGLTRMPFTEALEKYCSSSIDIESLVHMAIQEASSTACSDEKLAKAVHKMAVSFEETDALLRKMSTLLATVDSTMTEPPGLLEIGDALEKELAFGYGLSQLFMMHTKLSRMRKCIDCRPFLDEKRSGEFDRAALKERIHLLKEGNRYHLSFLYTMVAWGALQGTVLPNALTLAPLQDTTVILPGIH
jgi:hypothetical protein